MTTADGKTTDDAQIRALIDDRIKAVRAKDVSGAVYGMAPGVVSFDVINPLQRVGSGESEKRAEDWFASFEGPIGFDVRDLTIAVGEDVAFSHALHRYSGTKADGGKIGMWVRVTMGYRKVDGRWMITHEHQSVPFDPQTGAVSLHLEP